MKALLAALIFATPLPSFARNNVSNDRSLVFIENKGQITDQHSQPRNDIQFALPAGNMTVFIGNGQLHYQFAKLKQQNDNNSGPAGSLTASDPSKGELVTYRLDVALEGANQHAQVEATEKQEYREHYYLAHTGANGIHAATYRRITYKEIYPGIDWVIYINSKGLEHEFIVGPTGNAANIKFSYSGATSLATDAAGNLVATTPMGAVTEMAPSCFDLSGRQIASSFSVKGNSVTYDVKGRKGAMVIDPLLLWGTYYGPDSSTSPFYGVACDDSGKVYAAGLTWSGVSGSIATTGAYQEVFGGTTDAYVVKFDSSGNRIWATYYGGSNGDWATGIACDRNRNVYIGGVAFSTNGIASPGCHQPVYGGGARDGFLAKFNTDGVRQWGTYVGGTGANTPSSVSCDTGWHVYIAGESNDMNNISTPGSHQPVKGGGWDAFLVTFDTAGVRQWGTYYGGTSDEFGGVHTNDNQYIYLSSLTPSTTGIATIGAYQPTYTGGSDVFVAKLTRDGVRLWGSYYGGEGSDNMGGIACDRQGSIYILGTTTSNTAIATAGCYQSARAGGPEDAFLMKLEPELGFRVWGTYFGGTDAEVVGLSRIATDDSNHVYILGNTASTSGIASPDGLQTTYGGGPTDGFFSKFSSAGALEWSTYYGGARIDEVRCAAWDGKSVYICGITNSSENIATPGSFISSGGSASSYYQGFLSKFGYPDTVSTDTGTLVSTIDRSGNLGIFPNPNSGEFDLTGTVAFSGIAQAIVYDAAGGMVLRENFPVQNGKVDRRLKIQVAPGVYFLQTIFGDTRKTVKFVKE